MYLRVYLLLLFSILGLNLARPEHDQFTPLIEISSGSLPAQTISCLKMLPQQYYDHELHELKEWMRRTIKRCESPSPVVNKGGFHVMLDVHHFRPKEINVKIVDNHLVVEARHDEKQDDHGWILRQFVRRYQLPQNVNINDLTSWLSPNGLLTIVARKKQSLKDESQRTL